MHALSVLFAVLCVPVAFWARRTLLRPPHGAGSRRCSPAVNPFLTQYAQEGRMYSLVIAARR